MKANDPEKKIREKEDQPSWKTTKPASAENLSRYAGSKPLRKGYFFNVSNSPEN